MGFNLVEALGEEAEGAEEEEEEERVAIGRERTFRQTMQPCSRHLLLPALP